MKTIPKETAANRCYVYYSCSEKLLLSNAQPEIFQSNWGFVELGHFDKLFLYGSRKNGLAGKNFGVFSPRYS